MAKKFLQEKLSSYTVIIVVCTLLAVPLLMKYFRWVLPKFGLPLLKAITNYHTVTAIQRFHAPYNMILTLYTVLVVNLSACVPVLESGCGL